MKRSYPRYDEAGIGRARGLRRRMTPGETRLWQQLRRRQFGVSFNRQRPIGPYVADFYCAEARLVVEVDGWSHRERGEADLERQAFLEAQGLHVLRFGEGEAHRDPDGVARAIRDVVEVLQAKKPAPPLGEVDPAKPGRTEGVCSEIPSTAPASSHV